MNAIRHFLLRNSCFRRGLFFLVFGLLLLRALLSGTVMLDPDAPEGSYGLVICSGFGPMFPATPTSGVFAAAMASMSTGDMVMPAMRAAQRDSAAVKPATSSDALPVSTGGHAGGQDPSDSGGLCPFSAAFFMAIFSLLIVSLLLSVLTSKRVWRNAGPIVYQSLMRFGRPLSRGPPAYV